VKRTCPALDRQRATRTEARTTKRKTTAARVRDAALAKRSRGGEDLDVWARRFWRLPAMKENRRWRKTLPSITYRTKNVGRFSGHAKTWSKEIVVTLAPRLDAGRAIEIILHELVHCVAGHWHDKRFRTCLMACAAEAFPGIDFGFSAADGWTNYELDERISDGINEWLAREKEAAA
jgi:hypothetical protein